MKPIKIKKIASILLVFVSVCAVFSGGGVRALAQDDNVAQASLNESDHSTFLEVFSHSILAPYGVQSLGDEVPFSPLPLQIPELKICVPARGISGTPDPSKSDLFRSWHVQADDEEGNWPRSLEPILKPLDALFEQLFGVRPFEAYTSKTKGWPREPLNLRLPFGLHFRLPSLPSEAGL